MRREYLFGTKRVYKNLSDKVKNDIWAKVYEDNPDIKKILEEERRKQEGEQENYKHPLNYYWDDAILSEDKNEKFEEAAKALGIDVKEYIEERTPKHEYNFDKVPWDKSQTRAARNNLLITLIQRRLEDPSTARDRLAPGGFTHAKEAAAKIRKLMGIDYNSLYFANPLSMIRFNQQNQLAGKLIGIFANQNANHGMASLMSVFSLKFPIAFGSHIDKGLNNLLNPTALTKELLAASVDAVKDPVLNFLNLNTITADSAGLLCRLGYSFYDIGLLMNQPIIRELCNECSDQGIYDIQGYIEQKASKLEQITKASNVKLDISTLEEALRDKENFRRDSSTAGVQLAVLNKFREIYEAASEVNQFITNTKFTASNSVRSNFGNLYAQRDRVERYLQSVNSKKSNLVIQVSDFQSKPIVLNLLRSSKDRDSYFKALGNNPFGYEQVMYDTISETLQLLSKYYPYNNKTFRNARKYINDLIKSNLNEDLINKIHSFTIKYLASINSDSMFNPNYPINAIVDENFVETFTAKEYFTKVVPRLVTENIATLRQKYKLFKYIKTSVNNGNIVINIENVGGLTNKQKDEIRDSWEELFENNKSLAYDLFYYSYYQSGFGFGNIGFNHLCPLIIKLGLEVGMEEHINVEDGTVEYTPLRYTDFLNNILKQDDIKIDISEFCRKFIMENKDDKSLVYTPFGDTKTELGKLSARVNTFTVNSSNEKLKSLVMKTEQIKSAIGVETIYYFRPAIMIGDKLFMANNGNLFNKSYNGEMEYVLVNDSNSSSVVSGIFEDEIEQFVTVAPYFRTSLTSSNIGQLQAATQGIKEKATTDWAVPIGKQSTAEYEPIINIDIMTEEAMLNKIGELIGENSDAYKLLSKLKDRNELANKLSEEYRKLGVRCKLNGEIIC